MQNNWYVIAKDYEVFIINQVQEKGRSNMKDLGFLRKQRSEDNTKPNWIEKSC